MLSCLSDILKNGSKDYPSKMERVSGPARGRTMVGGDRTGQRQSQGWWRQDRLEAEPGLVETGQGLWLKPCGQSRCHPLSLPENFRKNELQTVAITV